MTTHSTALPATEKYAEELLRSRRSDYLAELEVLQQQVRHKNWIAEASEVAKEVRLLKELPLMNPPPSSDSFSALAKARSRYNRDVSVILFAAGRVAGHSMTARIGWLDSLGSVSRWAWGGFLIFGISARRVLGLIPVGKAKPADALVQFQTARL